MFTYSLTILSYHHTLVSSSFYNKCFLGSTWGWFLRFWFLNLGFDCLGRRLWSTLTSIYYSSGSQRSRRLGSRKSWKIYLNYWWIHQLLITMQIHHLPMSHKTLLSGTQILDLLYWFSVTSSSETWLVKSTKKLV